MEGTCRATPAEPPSYSIKLNSENIMFDNIYTVMADQKFVSKVHV